MRVKGRKFYVLQYREFHKWVDIKNSINGTYIKELGVYTGSKNPISENKIQKFMHEMNDFAEANYRIVERNVLMFDS